MGVLLVVALLGQAPERLPLPSKGRVVSEQDLLVPPVTKPQAPTEDFVITPQTGWTRGATTRFVGALLGGMTGMAMAALASAGLVAACRCTSTTGAGVFASAWPITSVVGATLGFSLTGGRASPGAAIAGSIGGLAAGLLLLLFHQSTVFAPTELGWGATLAVGALVAGLQALALETRHAALEEAPFIDATASRFALTALGTFGAIAVDVLLTFGASLVRGPVNAGPFVLIATAALTPLVPWAIHRGLGGEGSLGAAYIGWVASLALAAGGAALVLFASGTPFAPAVDVRAATMLSGSLGLITFAGVFGMPLLLEWSHGNARQGRARVGPRVDVHASVAPLTGPHGLSGGALAVGGTF